MAKEPKYTHWIEAYEGAEVVVQLIGVQYSVRPPGRVIVIDELGRPTDHPSGPVDLHKMPVVEGVAEVLKDKQGNYMLVVITPDMLGSAAKVRIAINPQEIHSVTITEEPTRIVS